MLATIIIAAIFIYDLRLMSKAHVIDSKEDWF